MHHFFNLFSCKLGHIVQFILDLDQGEQGSWSVGVGWGLFDFHASLRGLNLLSSSYGRVRCYRPVMPSNRKKSHYDIQVMPSPLMFSWISRSRDNFGAVRSPQFADKGLDILNDERQYCMASQVFHHTSFDLIRILRMY
jgi:hypothetical protein